MIMPFGTYMTPNRLMGLAAVFCSAESAGTMLSSSGSASIAPMPRSTVRRGIAFFAMIIVAPFCNLLLLAPSSRMLSVCCADATSPFDHCHAERRALDDAA